MLLLPYALDNFTCRLACLACIADCSALTASSQIGQLLPPSKLQAPALLLQLIFPYLIQTHLTSIDSFLSPAFEFLAFISCLRRLSTYTCNLPTQFPRLCTSAPTATTRGPTIPCASVSAFSPVGVYTISRPTAQFSASSCVYTGRLQGYGGQAAAGQAAVDWRHHA